MKIDIEAIKEKIDCFIIDITPTFVYRLKDKWHDFIYGRFINRHWQIKTKLPKRAWYDSDTRILYGMMAVLEEFYEKELSQDIVHWDGDEPHKNARFEMEVIYRWWKNYINREQEISDTLDAWSDRIGVVVKERKLAGDKIDDKFDGFLGYINSHKKDEEAERLFKLMEVLERNLIEEEQDMLIRLIKIRRFMWT